MRTTITIASARPPATYALHSPDMADWSGAPRLRPLQVDASTNRYQVVPILNATPGSTIAALGLPAGATLNSATRQLVFTTPGIKTLSLVETLAGYDNSPRTTEVTISVANSGPTLAALSVPISADFGSAISITGATQGSTLTLQTAVDGVTINSGARSLSFATPGSYVLTLVETLEVATNSPRVTPVAIRIVPDTKLLLPGGDALLQENGEYILQEAA